MSMIAPRWRLQLRDLHLYQKATRVWPGGLSFGQPAKCVSSSALGCTVLMLDVLDLVLVD